MIERRTIPEQLRLIAARLEVISTSPPALADAINLRIIAEDVEHQLRPIFAAVSSELERALLRNALEEINEIVTKPLGSIDEALGYVEQIRAIVSTPLNPMEENA